MFKDKKAQACWDVIARNNYADTFSYLSCSPNPALELSKRIDCNRMLHLACLYGHMESVRAILHIQPSALNSLNLKQMPLLFLAVNNAQLFSYLLTQGANPLHQIRFMYRPLLPDKFMKAISCKISILDMLHANGCLASAMHLLGTSYGAMCYLQKYHFHSSSEVLAFCDLYGDGCDKKPTRQFLDKAAQLGKIVHQYQAKQKARTQLNRKCLSLFNNTSATIKAGLMSCKVAPQLTLCQWLIMTGNTYLLTNLFISGAWNSNVGDQLASHWNKLDIDAKILFANTLAHALLYLAQLQGNIGHPIALYILSGASKDGESNAFCNTIKNQFLEMLGENTHEAILDSWNDLSAAGSERLPLHALAKHKLQRTFSSDPTPSVQTTCSSRTVIKC